jgi:hypothetical protein
MAGADLTLEIEPGKTGSLGPFNATPYVQESGDLYIDVDEGFAGLVRACQAPCI